MDWPLFAIFFRRRVRLSFPAWTHAVAVGRAGPEGPVSCKG